MEFKLQPGDYIPTSEVPVDKRQAVIDAFVSAGAMHPSIPVEPTAFDDYASICWLQIKKVLIMALSENFGNRRVTLEQILGEQSPSWDEVGPELLRVSLANLQTMFWTKARLEEKGLPTCELDTAIKETEEAITKARSIK